MQPDDPVLPNTAETQEEVAGDRQPVWNEPASDNSFFTQTAPPPPPPPRRDPFWGYTDVAIFIGILFGCFVAVGAVLAFSGIQGTHLTPMLVLVANCFMYVAIYVALLAVFAGRYRQSVFRSLGWRRTPARILGLALAGAVILTLAVQLIGNLLHTPKIETPMDEYLSTTPRLIAFGLMAVTLAPIFEELVFRGFLQPLFTRTFGVAIGIVITAVLFGSLHASEYHLVWQYVTVVSIVGLALGWVRWRTNSLIPSTIMHASYNAMLVIAVGVSHFQKSHVV